MTSSPSNAKPGSVVTVTVTAKAASDLYAYDLDVSFDRRDLSYVGGAQAGTSGATYADRGLGEVHVIHTKLGSLPPASGEVVLAKQQFRAARPGATSVTATSLAAVDDADQTNTTTNLGSTTLSILPPRLGHIS